MLDKIKNLGSSSAEYREESIKVPSVITVVVLLVMTAPLASWILRINREGTLATDVSKYETLVKQVSTDVQMVEAMMRDGSDTLAAINNAQKTQAVTLIVPEIIIVDEPSSKTKNKPLLGVELEGIYWHPVKPLVGINGETHRVGDMIHDYEIIEIGKAKVKFKGLNGKIVEKGMDDDLMQKRR